MCCFPQKFYSQNTYCDASINHKDEEKLNNLCFNFKLGIITQLFIKVYGTYFKSTPIYNSTKDM